MMEGASKAASRSERFAIHLPVRYREPNSAGWFEGETENISGSGVLFRTESLLNPNTTVEVRLALPVAIKGEAPCEIVCTGIIVRTEHSNIAGLPSALAVAIQNYRFTRIQQFN